MRIIDSKIWYIGTKIYDLITINLLWMIFSIPLITLGPATNAGLKCIEELEDGSSQNIFLLYLKNFKSNFFSYMLSVNTLLGVLIVFVKLTISLLYSDNFILSGLCMFIGIECILALGVIFSNDYKNPIDLILNSIITGNKKALNVLISLIIYICIFLAVICIPILLPIAISSCIFISYKVVYKIY